MENESSTILKLPLINLRVLNLPAETTMLTCKNLERLDLVDLKAHLSSQINESENEIAIKMIKGVILWILNVLVLIIVMCVLVHKYQLKLLNFCIQSSS